MNLIIQIQALSYLIKYCDDLFKQFIGMVKEEEQRNEKLKYEFQDYKYKKVYNTRFEVSIKDRGQSFSSMTCKSYESFIEAVNNKHLNNVSGVTIILDISYKRGKNMEFDEHKNNFQFIFKPYDIKFIRKSSFNEIDMNQLENNFNLILKQFKVQNSIFCTRD